MQAIDTRTAPSPLERAATIQFLDGTTREGKVVRFVAAAAELLFELPPRSGTSPARVRIPCEKVAAIAFGSRAPGTPPVPGAVRVSLVLVTDQRLTVDAVLDGKPPTGFFACGVGNGEREFFFYDHGIRSKERVELLGTMLVAAGVTSNATVQRALAVQTEDRRLTIGDILVAQKRIEQSAVEQAAVMQSRKKLRLGEVLLEAGLVTQDDIDRALAEQQKNRGRRLGTVLVELGMVSEEALAATIARKFCMPFVDLASVDIDEGAVREIPREVLEKHGFLPLGSDARTLTVAISDPLDASAAEVMRFHTKKRIVEVVVTPSQLKVGIERFLRGEKAAPVDNSREIERLLEEIAATEGVETAVGKPAAERDKQLSESDSAVIKLTNRILLDAVMRGASDVHIETNGTEHNSVVRLRIDGDCVPYQELPPSYRRSIVARLKIMADLDISERRKPQDGKIRFRMPDRVIELRVATIPTVNDNEDMVLRVLANAKPQPLDRLELSARNLVALKEVIAKPYGLILCVGPTGSGKTTTLHSVLGAINTPDMKIWTAEDPVEITQAGLRQVQVNARIGFTFAAAMRSFLRADPDVIMVGEMRDPETANTAIEASLTGHLVLSTLHTNSAPETVTRLLEMGLDPFSFGDALLGVLAQRLVRAFCASCREPYQADADEVRLLERTYGGATAFRGAFDLEPQAPVRLFRAPGCTACGGTGYKGRLALHELLVSDDGVRGAVARKAPAEEIRRLAMAGGMRTLGQDGIEKCLRGATDLRQVLMACTR